MTSRSAFHASLLIAVGCAGQSPATGTTVPVPVQPVLQAQALTPRVDHHKHLMSPATAAWGSEKPLPTVAVPEPIAALIRQRTQVWNDSAGLARLFTDSSIVLDDRSPAWIVGRPEAADFISTLFARQYRITPVAFRQQGSTAYLAGYYSRDIETGVRHFGHALLSLTRGTDGRWLIAAESPSFPGPTILQPLLADQLIAELDSAGIQRALVLSLAYWFGSAFQTPVADEYERVKAENDWVAQQAAQHPDRLVAFCSFNPLRDYALEELERCVSNPNLRGLKLHFGNSGVNVKNPEHVAKVQRVFAAVNARRLPILVHLWTGGAYNTEGREHATIFLEQILSRAPETVVVIAHFAGGGPGYTDPALGVYAEAIAAGDPRARNVYFDIATVADRQSPEVLETFAARIRQIGVERVLWGSDMSPPNESAGNSWETFRQTVPLTEAEFRAIADNAAPFLR